MHLITHSIDHPTYAAGVAFVDRPLHVVGMPAVLRALSRGAALVAIAIGAAVLFGYAIRWEAVVDLHSSLPPMYPNAALGVLVGGISALAASSHRRRRQLGGVAGFVLLLAFAGTTFVLHAVDAGPTVLEALWPDDDTFVAATTPVGGRPVVETCVAFIAVSVAGILLARRRGVRWSQGLALGCVSVGAGAVLGYALGVDRISLGTSFVVVGMSLQTGIGLACVGLAVLMARPTAGMFGLLTHAGPTARLGRRLVVVVVMAPIALTAAGVLLDQLMPDAALVQSVMAIGQVLVLGLLVLVPLAAADDVEHRAERLIAEARIGRERGGEEAPIAAAITAQVLARPAAPDGWEVGFRQVAAFAALPGDSCQVLPGRHGRVLVSLIDVAGHGTGPALESLRLRHEIAALWRADAPLGRIADSIDASVTEMGTIATGVLLVIDSDGGGCEYVNAGHPPVVAINGGVNGTWGRTAPLLGLGSSWHRPQWRRLQRETMLVLYTDGITEARDTDGRQLGIAAIEHAMRIHSVVGAQAVADACVDAALAHSARRLNDDALALVLCRH